MKRRNKRTFKKRIRKIISLCILVTVLLFGGIVVLLTSVVSKSQAGFITQYYSNFIGDTMSSEYFLNQMGIRGLEQFDPKSTKAKEWLDSLKALSENRKVPVGQPTHPRYANDVQDINIAIYKHFKPEEHLIFFQPGQVSQIEIVLGGKEIYKSPNWGKISSLLDAPLSKGWEQNQLRMGLLNYFTTESRYPLFDSKNREVGSVIVRADAGFTLLLFAVMAFIIGLTALLCLIIANIVSKFFTISITGPLKQLEEKIRAIASGDYQSTINAQIVLKKPLREIESLAYSTNVIMHKMKEYSDLLESQKGMLKSQNEELEAQNEDLIESKRQIEEAQALLVQSENMASIGQLTAAITHEINTPLGAINSNSQLSVMLLNSLMEDQSIKSKIELFDLVSQIKESNDISAMACERVIQIIKSLKNFTKLDQAEFQEADINEGIRSVLVLTSNLWKNKITLHENYSSLPAVKCFSGLLNQVFMNVIVNAIQAIEDKGDITINTHMDDQYVYASIRDTGCGIKEEYLSRIFDMGFSTKEAGLGAGLGLSICNNIMKKHGGEIRVSSEVGKFTEFVVCIPTHMETFTQAADEAAPSRAGE